MRFTLHLFGCELFSLYIGPEQDTTDDLERDDEPSGDRLSMPIGFMPSPPDQRWDTCPQPGIYEE